MAIERIRQQRTPTQFGADATSLSDPSFEASSFSQQGVVDRSKAVQYMGNAQAAESFGNLATNLVEQGQQFHEGMQLADLEQQHEDNINAYINSKNNPQLAQDAAIDAHTLNSVSNSLWNKLGDGASIEDIDAVEKHFQDRLSTMKKALNQGVMTPDEFSQRSLAITREAINRNPALHDEIINHTKKVMNLSGMDDLLAAEKQDNNNAEKQYQKRVDFAMQISKENNVPHRYDRYGNFDLQYAEEQNAIVQKEKFAAAAIAQQGALRTEQDKQQAADFTNRFGIQGVNGLLNQTHDQLIGILQGDTNHANGLNIARQAYQNLKQGVAERAGPLLHLDGVKDVVDYANKQADATLSMLEKFHTKEDQVKFLQNQAQMARDQDFINVSKVVSPQAMNMLTQIMSTANAPRLLATEQGRVVMGKITKTLGNVLSGVTNGLDTDYSVKDPSGRNTVANAVDILAGSATKGDSTSASGLENIINTVYADTKNSKFSTTADKYKFYDDYIKVLGNQSNKEGIRNLGEVASGRASENLEEYMQLTLQNFRSDVAAVSNKGTEVKLSTLPDGRLNIQTSNQTDTDYLLQKYGIRVNNGLRAFSNLIGSDTRKAAEVLYPKYDALKDLIPQQEGNNFGNRKDGTPKGNGFLGVLQRPDGGVSTELATGVNIGGKEMDIPLIVPTLSKNEVSTLLSLKDGEAPPRSIIDKAVAHAKERISAGLSPFASNSESPQQGGKPNASNPLNLTVPGKQGVFQQFNSTEDGIRAASSQLDRYFNGQTTGKPLQTLDQIAGLWNNENEKGSTSKSNYVKTLVKYTGFDPNSPLDLNNPSVKADLLHAMSIAEGRPIRPSQIIAALGIK